MGCVVDRWVHLMEAGDLSAVLELYAQEAEITNPAGSIPIIGIENISSYYTELSRLDLDFCLSGSVIKSGESAVIPCRYLGDKLTIEAVTLLEIESEKIAREKIYWSYDKERC